MTRRKPAAPAQEPAAEQPEAAAVAAAAEPPALSAEQQARLDRIADSLSARLADLVGEEEEGDGPGPAADLTLEELDEWWDEEDGAGAAATAGTTELQATEEEAPAQSGKRAGRRSRWAAGVGARRGGGV